MTVRLGLKSAALLELALLSIGGILCGTGFIIEFFANSLAVLGASLFIMAAAYVYILSKYARLYAFSKKLDQTEHRPQIEQDIVNLATENPKWITLITQSIVIVCLVLLISKFL
jgi:hypothetical protein